MNTEINTPRLKLSPFQLIDAKDVFAYASNPKVAKTVTWNTHASIADSEAFINEVMKPKTYVFHAWAVRIENRAVGSISFFMQNDIAGQIDYALGADYWGKGLITEAAQAVCDWAYTNYPKLLRIQAVCLPTNTASRRVMEKIGMQFEGDSRMAMLVKGVPSDLARYALLRG